MTHSPFRSTAPELDAGCEQLRQKGWVLLGGACDTELLTQLQSATAGLAVCEDEAVRGREGAVYAARNILQLCPRLITLWKTPRLAGFVRRVLGPEAGLVRGLFFDKPPEQTWALPWHKDLLIAVRDDAPAAGYSRPRLRAGVWHAEPPVEILENMLTLRFHLDPMTDSNGPLEVLSGSQTTGKTLVCTGFREERILSSAGDVLAMRPLLVHSSGRSVPNTGEHRRVVHLEFSGCPQLPEGVRWNLFAPIDG